MPTVTDFTKAYGVQPNTIRHWSANFADFLSPGANPEKGKRRMYSYDDAEVIALIAEMRQQYESYDNIRASLAAGDRGLWSPEASQAAQDDARDRQSGEGTPMALITQLTAKASQLEGQLGAIREERDYLRDQLQQSQDAARESEKRATIAETKLEAMSVPVSAENAVEMNLQKANETPGQDESEEKPLSRRQRLARWIAGEG